MDRSCPQGICSRALTTCPSCSHRISGDQYTATLCSQRGITPSFSCAVTLSWFLSRPALIGPDPRPGPGISVLACVVTHKCRAQGQACTSYHNAPLAILPRLCLPSVSPLGQNTRYKTPAKHSQSLCLASALAPVSCQGIMDGKVDKYGLTKHSSGPLVLRAHLHSGVRQPDLLQTRISASAHNAALHHFRRY